MGYTGLNGASATSISALHKYGLLERVGEEIKVSERALRILHPHSPNERAEAVRDAAGEPELFQELAERFPGKMPNDDLLKNYLVRKGFAPGALTSVISAYRDTSDMVERHEADYNSGLGQSEEEPMNAHTQPSQQTPVPPQQTMLFQSDGRQIGRYDFEGGAFVRIVASGEVDTESALDMAQTIIDLKRKELARRNKLDTVVPPGAIAYDENTAEQQK